MQFRITSSFRLLFASIALMAVQHASAQILIGTEGMLNVPTADMRPAGTFDGGASVLQKNFPYKRNYITGIYYIDFTPFSWMEITYRETLLRTNRKGTLGFHEQDRSTTIRLRPLKEGKYWPALVVGSNDIYSDHGGSVYANIYGVATKHVDVSSVGTFSATLGYSHARKKGVAYDGVMGGVTYSPEFFPEMKVIADYDTRGVNFGVTVFLFNHLHLSCFTHKFAGINGTISYQYTIPY